ncbi:TcaA NTF2-like domain-containing protein [Staphylococcus warneri]
MNTINNEDVSQSILKRYKGRIILFAIFIIAVIIIYIFVYRHSAKAQIKQLEEDINQHHYTALAHTLSSSDKKMTKNEAKKLVTYFENEKHQRNFNHDIKQIKENLKGHHDSSNLGSIKNDRNEPIISFTQDGKRFFFIDHIAMKVHYRKVYVKEGQQQASYKFEGNKKGVSNKSSTSYIGEFIDGNYDVPTEKIFKEEPVKGNVSGHLHVNTEKRTKDNKIIATQTFNQTKFKVALHNDDIFKRKNIALFINGHRMDESLDQTFGYYPNRDTFNVYAEGQYKGHTFKSNKVDVMQGLDQSTQIVNLKFDKDKIQKTVDNDKKEEKAAGELVKTYMKHLNEAYKKTSYEPISEDIAVNSKAEKFMKPKFKHKQNIKYNNVKIESTKKKNNQIEVIISKKYKDNVIHTRYQIKHDKDGYNIVNIEDV